jgi:hypothetical protein
MLAPYSGLPKYVFPRRQLLPQRKCPARLLPNGAGSPTTVLFPSRRAVPSGDLPSLGRSSPPTSSLPLAQQTAGADVRPPHRCPPFPGADEPSPTARAARCGTQRAGRQFSAEARGGREGPQATCPTPSRSTARCAKKRLAGAGGAAGASTSPLWLAATYGASSPLHARHRASCPSAPRF